MRIISYYVPMSLSLFRFSGFYLYLGWWQFWRLVWSKQYKSRDGDRTDAMVLVMASSWGAARRANYANNLTLVRREWSWDRLWRQWQHLWQCGGSSCINGGNVEDLIEPLSKFQNDYNLTGSLVPPKAMIWMTSQQAQRDKYSVSQLENNNRRLLCNSPDARSYGVVLDVTLGVEMERMSVSYSSINIECEKKFYMNYFNNVLATPTCHFNN